MRTRRRFIRRRYPRNRYVVLAKCPTCGHEEEIATFQRSDQAKTWVRGIRSKRQLTIIREV